MNNVTVAKPQSFGIKETNDWFDLADEFLFAGKKAKEDGKVDWKDIPVFMGVPVKLLTAINGMEKVDDELTDLDDSEIAELERRIASFGGNPRYANLVGHLMAAGNELVAIIKEDKAQKAA